MVKHPRLKYNLFKGFSTALTFLTPILTASFCGEFWDTPERTMSTTSVFACLISLFFAKDKLAEKFKSPTAVVIALIVFVFCIISELIIKQLKIVSLATLIACVVDEVTFKKLYINVEKQFEESSKFCGFVTSVKIKEVELE